MSVEKRERGGKITYVVRWRQDGKPKSKSFDKKGLADRYDAKIRNALAEGGFIDHGRAMTVGEYSEKWVRRQAVLLKPKTVQGYETLLRNRIKPRFGEVPLNKITYGAVADWVTDTAAVVGASQVRQAYHLLTGMLDDAVKEGLIAANSARGVDLPRLPSNKKRAITHTQLADLADASGRYGLMIKLLGRTGLRWGEMAAMRVGSVIWDEDDERFILDVHEAVVEVAGKQILGPPKSHQERQVPIPRSLSDEVAAHVASKKPGELLFPSYAGTPMRVGNFRRHTFDRAVAATGLEGLTPHELRHTAATLASKAGARVEEVQAMLGHAKPSTTLDVYTHLFSKSLGDVQDRMDAAESKARRRPGLRAV